MKFGEALEILKQGGKVQRKGWNGKGQYIELATNVSYKNTNGDIINVNHETMGNNAIAFVGTSGVQLGWLASQADMLSEDWQVIEKMTESELHLLDSIEEQIRFSNISEDHKKAMTKAFNILNSNK